MSKAKRISLSLLGTVLVAGLGAGVSFVVFVYTDIGKQWFGSVTKIHDKNVENQESLKKLEQELQSIKANNDDLAEQKAVLQKSIAALEKESVELEKQINQEYRLSVDNRETLVAFKGKKLELARKIKSIRDKIEQVTPLHTLLMRVSDSLLEVSGNLRSLEELTSEVSKHQDIIGNKLVEVEQAAQYNWGFWKEVVLYTIGLKLLWGLFTGYSASTSVYYSQKNLLEANERYQSMSDELEVKISRASSQLQRSIAVATDVVKQAEELAAFDPALQLSVVQQVKAPFFEAVEKARTLKNTLARAKTLLDIKVREGLGGWVDSSVVSLASQLQEELQLPKDSSAQSLYTLFETTLAQANTSLEEFRKTLVSTEDVIADIISQKLMLDTLKSELEDLEVQYKAMESIEVRIGGTSS